MPFRVPRLRLMLYLFLAAIFIKSIIDESLIVCLMGYYPPKTIHMRQPCFEIAD